MSYYIIIRGPLGCGKSTISKALAKELNAEYFPVDKVVDEFGLNKDTEEGYVSQRSFFKANEVIAERSKVFLDKGKPVILDGNFYWKSTIADLEKRLNYRHYVFTLKASVDVCVSRDNARQKSRGEDSAIAIYEKSTSFNFGRVIETENKSVHETLESIKKILSSNVEK